MDIVLLSRIQFAFHIAFHYLFPPLTIGLSLLMVIMEGSYLITKQPIYEKMTKFWVHIFAIIFAVGVATGLVQVFAFGTNWENFSRFVGDVFGSILGAEGVFAFFLESGFIALLLFGWNKVGPKTHFFSTLMVAIGSHFSGIWIVAANSWMQTPAGYKIIGEGAERHAVMTKWWEAVNNPSTIDRLIHVLIGCWLAGAFLVLSVSAYYLLKNRHYDFARKAFRLSLIMATFFVVAQALSGDATGRLVAKVQPIKLAAMEGVFETETPSRMMVVGVANEKERATKGLSIPGLLSFLVYRNVHEAVPGLNQVPEELWPPVGTVFQVYHIMLYMWGCMVVTCILAWIAFAKKRKTSARWMLWVCVFSVLFPEIANQMGWFTAEIGRQPWVVYGLMRTADGATHHLHPGQIIFSLGLFLLVYALLFAMFVYLLDRKIKHGPDDSSVYDEYRDPYKMKDSLRQIS
ncbi:MAG: cytochrome ubiquinol oxidase subunit I [Verrucomicrobia bacterium]|nr:cytochrome ubiquinol oxidase subunit I [Verrucomicrobiota bacterium]MBS0646726.1 cytochrome ubiquinol oxidase subunit I [Verrucomicrobiota bacterium]